MSSLVGLMFVTVLSLTMRLVSGSDPGVLLGMLAYLEVDSLFFNFLWVWEKERIGLDCLRVLWREGYLDKYQGP